MNKKILVGVGLIGLLSAILIYGLEVGSSQTFDINLSCDLPYDNDFSDANKSGRYYYYIWHIVKDNQIVEESSLIPLTTNSINTQVTRNFDKTGLFVLRSYMRRLDLQDNVFMGGGIQTSDSICDESIQSVDVVNSTVVPVTNIEIQPTKDSYVSSANPTINYGSSIYIVTSDRAIDRRRAYMFFDLTSVGTSNVDLAQLTLTQYVGSTINQPISLMYCNNIVFDELTLTWNNQPAQFGVTTGNPLDGNCVLVSQASTNTWDVKNIVNSELSGDKQFTLVVKYPTEVGATPYKYTYFRSINGVSGKPKIDLSYT